jgi:hypothetical protein
LVRPAESTSYRSGWTHVRGEETTLFLTEPANAIPSPIRGELAAKFWRSVTDALSRARYAVATSGPVSSLNTFTATATTGTAKSVPAMPNSAPPATTLTRITTGCNLSARP